MNKTAQKTLIIFIFTSALTGLFYAPRSVRADTYGNLICSPSAQTINAGGTVRFTATGGNGNYYWFGYGAYPFSKMSSENTFEVAYNQAGQYKMYLTSNDQLVYCNIEVLGSTGADLSMQSYATSTGYNYNNFPVIQLSLQTYVKNITKGETVEKTQVTASPNDTLEFTIKTRSLSQYTLNNVIIKDVLPGNLNYISRTTSINGIITIDGITNYSGINIGSVYPGQEVTLKFNAVIAPANNFSSGQTSLTNLVTVSADNFSGTTSSLPIMVSKDTAATTNGHTGTTNGPIAKVAGVATGTSGSLALSLALSMFITYLYAFYAKTSLFKKREIATLIKRDKSDKNKFNFVNENILEK